MASRPGRPIPGERCEKRFPLGQQPSRLASRQNRAGKGKGLADQRANIVPAASGKPQRLRRYRLQPLPAVWQDRRRSPLASRQAAARSSLLQRFGHASECGDRFACSIKGIRSASVVREGGAMVMRGLVMTGADRRPFSLLAWFENQRGCSSRLITTDRNCSIVAVGCNQSLDVTRPEAQRPADRKGWNRP